MKPTKPRILTINGGSSSIKFALFEAGNSLQRILGGAIERIGLEARSSDSLIAEDQSTALPGLRSFPPRSSSA